MGTRCQCKSGLSGARFGFLGNTYSGMLDMYSDFTMFQGQTGAHLEVLEMCDLNRAMETVTPEEVAQKRNEIAEFFRISEDSAADPLAKSLQRSSWSGRQKSQWHRKS